jgi:diguanylate cyclase
VLNFENSPEFLAYIIDRVSVGIVVVDKDMKVMLWNNFMVTHSGKRIEEVLGTNLFETFPELPSRWFLKKIRSVFMLKNFAFTSWRQRPYLFKFPNDRALNDGLRFMNQDLILMPLKNRDGDVDYVCITLIDTTDVAISQTRLHATLTQLEAISRIDGLTQVFNRAFWEQCLIDEFARVLRYGGAMSLIMFDLDHFKTINDSHGHPAGDEVLRVVMVTVKRILRENDIAGRYGGEEFGVILPSTGSEGAVVVAERIRQAVASEPVVYKANKIFVSISLGIGVFNASVRNHEELIAQADAALYLSKKNGRNRWHVFPYAGLPAAHFDARPLSEP